MQEDAAQAAQFLTSVIASTWLAPSLWVAVQLRLGDRLADGPRGVADLAAETGTDELSLARLLNGLCSVGAFKRAGPRSYAGTPMSNMLRPEHPSGLANRINAGLGGENYLAWGSLLGAVQTGGSAFEIQHGMNWVEYLRANKERHAAFAAAMTSTTRLAEQALLDSHDFGSFNLAVDIGGSHGSLIGALLERHPATRGIVFDLPETIASGLPTWVDAPFAHRLRAIGGDFFVSVPSGDLYLLKQILHDWTDVQSLEILKTIRRAIPPHGRIAIIETFLPKDDPSNAGWGRDVVMMAITGGRERTVAEYEHLFAQSGFAPIGYNPTKSRFGVLEGKPV